MIVITGAGGMIGSGLAWTLNERGRTDLILVDDIEDLEKQHNVDGLHFKRLMGIQEFRDGFTSGTFDSEGVEAVFHLGACSSTREMNWDYLLDNNVRYTQELMEWCVKHGIRFIYASSAATYGDGSSGYSDAPEFFDALKPLNPYGRSKLEVDIWARDIGYLDTVVGLRYFNVFGPNEFHKGAMRSLLAKTYAEAQEKGTMELFKSYDPAYADGEQKRDFIYVKDAVAMTLYFFDTPSTHGVFNIGSGKAESWNALVECMGDALGTKLGITYIDMPEDMRKHYQYFTEADVRTLRAAGCTLGTRSLKDSVEEYLTQYLLPHKHLRSSSTVT